MKQQHLLLALLFGIAPAALADVPAIDATSFEKSPFAACQDVGLISKSDYKKNKEFWDDARDRCGVQVQVMADSGFMTDFLRHVKGKTRSKEDKVATAALLKNVGERTDAQLGLNAKINRLTSACFHGDKEEQSRIAATAANSDEKAVLDPTSCDAIKRDTRKVAEEYGSKARVQNAVLHRLAGLFGSLTNGVQWLSGYNTALENAKLTRDEEKQVAARMKAVDAKITEGEKALGKPVLGDSEARQAAYSALVEQVRTEELKAVGEEFRQTLSAAPMVAFLSNSDPSDVDFEKAVREVATRAEKEQAKVRETLKKGEAAVGYEAKIKAMESLFTDYGPMVEASLKADPSQCGTATLYANHLGRRDGAMTVAKIGAIVGGSLLTGGVAGPFGAAAAAGVGTLTATGLSIPLIYIPDRAKAIAAEQRAHSNAFNVEGKAGKGVSVADMKDFQEARDAFVMDLAMSPTELLGAPVGALGKVAYVRLFERPAVAKAASQALQRSGASADEALQIMKDLRGKDAQKSTQAFNKLVGALDVNSDEVKIMRNLYKSGVLDKNNARNADRALVRLRQMAKEESPERMKEIYARIDEALSHIDPAKINAGNREQVYETVVSGMQFGAEPKRIASLVTDWESGLEGLTGSFQRARKYVDAPEIKNLPAEARERAAFQKGLDEMRDINPELKAMPEDQWKKMREEMTTCPMGPAKAA